MFFGSRALPSGFKWDVGWACEHGIHGVQQGVGRGDSGLGYAKPNPYPSSGLLHVQYYDTPQVWDGCYQVNNTTVDGWLYLQRRSTMLTRATKSVHDVYVYVHTYAPPYSSTSPLPPSPKYLPICETSLEKNQSSLVNKRSSGANNPENMAPACLPGNVDSDQPHHLDSPSPTLVL